MRLIDADALIEDVRKHSESYFADDFAHYWVNKQPTIKSERKTGRWIYGESEVGNDGYYCSECGNFVPWIYEESAMNFIREYKFCPNCRAKMKGGEADE